MSEFEMPKPANPQETKEKERAAEQDKKMRLSSELIERPILDGEPGYDKIFLLGKAEKKDGEWIIDIDSDTPTVALNQDIKNEFDLKDSPIVKDVRDRKVGSNLSLISGGSFVWITQQGKSELVLLRRDVGAPVDAGCLTGPAGRCGEAPSLTTLNESNEELIIVKSKTMRGKERFKLLGFYGEEISKTNIVHQKLRQVKVIHDYLMAQGRTEDAQILKLIRGEEDVEVYSLNQNKKPVDHADRVTTRVNGQTVDVIENGIVFLDEATNTLEIREIIDVNLPEGSEIVKVLDGEVFGRDIVRASSLDNLEGEKMVASLQDYFKRVKEGSL